MCGCRCSSHSSTPSASVGADSLVDHLQGAIERTQFDAALLKRSAQVNGLSGLCITKLDVLDGLEELQICTGYELDGQRIDLLPLGADEIERCTPIYEIMEGWSQSTVGVTNYDKLPVQARLYLQRIEHVTGVPIHLISTSPDRDHTILMRHPFLVD